MVSDTVGPPLVPALANTPRNQPAFRAINVEAEENEDDEIDTLRELQVRHILPPHEERQEARLTPLSRSMMR
jgi:hypothetical protein